MAIWLGLKFNELLPTPTPANAAREQRRPFLGMDSVHQIHQQDPGALCPFTSGATTPVPATIPSWVSGGQRQWPLLTAVTFSVNPSSAPQPEGFFKIQSRRCCPCLKTLISFYLEENANSFLWPKRPPLPQSNPFLMVSA